MNNSLSPNCPNCGQPLSIHIDKANGGYGRVPAMISSFANGVGIAPMPYKLHRKPIHELKADHFVTSAIVGGLSATAILVGTGVLCYVGNVCLTDLQTIASGLVGGLGAGLATLRFIDNGRYEVKEESQPQTVAITAPVPATATAPHTVEIKTVRPNGQTNWHWFKMPDSLTPEAMRKVAVWLRVTDWKYSRPSICKRGGVLTQNQFHDLTELLKDKELLKILPGNRSELTAAGRVFLKSFIPSEDMA